MASLSSKSYSPAKMYGFPTANRLKVVVLALAMQVVKVEAMDTKLYNASSMPSNCQDAMNSNPMRGSGVYVIYLPNSGLLPFQVYCLEDPLFTMPWTIIQRRTSPDEDFFRGWQDYKLGFGDLYTNYWLGLDKIHALTSQPNNTHELWIQMTEKFTVDARYSRFVIGDEYSKYKLKGLGVFTGIRGDALRLNAAEMFSTYDADNDRDSGSCAKTKHGGYWYYNCGNSNLNGIYGSASKTEGLSWNTWEKHGVLEYVHMAIRPVGKRKV